jgi:hypothetical protein
MTIIPKSTHDEAWWEAQTRGMDFSKADHVDPVAFNRIVWKGLKANILYPTVRSGADLGQNRNVSPAAKSGSDAQPSAPDRQQGRFPITTRTFPFSLHRLESPSLSQAGLFFLHQLGILFHDFSQPRVRAIEQFGLQRLRIHVFRNRPCRCCQHKKRA